MTEALRMRRRIEATRTERLVLTFTAACGVALSSGVIAALVYLLLALFPLVAVRPAFSQPAPVSAGVRLQAGIEKEDVDGDLKSAMAIYEKIAGDTSAPRDVRARALLRLAGCDEKLGRQAKQVYEQIVHDYADQAEASQARKRLAVIQQQEHPAPPTTMSVRKIEWADLGLMGPGDTDGQRAVFQDSKGNLFFGDLAGRSKRLVFKAQTLGNPGWTPSKDFSLVALQWNTKGNRPATIAVVRTDGAEYHELIHGDAEGNILGNTAINNEADFVVSWSWDNRNLLILNRVNGGGGSLVLLSVADGSHHELLHIDKQYLEKAAFSPDGRFVAYEITPRDGPPGPSSHIFVVPVQGGEPHQVYESAPRPADTRANAIPWTLQDWTADGRNLIVADLNLGKPGLYLLPVKDGLATGAVSFLRYGVFEGGNTTQSGSFVYADQTTQKMEMDPFLAALDSDDRPGKWRLLDLRGGLAQGHNPWASFSPDGKLIAYLAGDDDPDRHDLVLRDLSTGKDRILYRAVGRRLFCQFSNQTPRVFCTIRGDIAEKTDLVSIAVDSGQVEKLATFDNPIHFYRSGPDDQTFYLSRSAMSIAAGPMVRWNQATHEETLLMPARAAGAIGDEKLSPDGHSTLLNSPDSLSTRPLSGGEWKALVTGDDWQGGDTANTADGNWILYHSIDASGKHCLFRVPIDGGRPEWLGDFPTHSFRGSFHLSADGRQVLFMSAEFNQNDLWVLDNFVPPAKK